MKLRLSFQGDMEDASLFVKTIGRKLDVLRVRTVEDLLHGPSQATLRPNNEVSIPEQRPVRSEPEPESETRFPRPLFEEWRDNIIDVIYLLKARQGPCPVENWTSRPELTAMSMDVL